MPENQTSPGIEVNGVPINWNTDSGTFEFFAIKSALFWINPSLLTMLQPLAAEVGKDLFRLLVASSASIGTDEDYQAMVSTLGENFEEGFMNWGKAVSAAGWGSFELLSVDWKSKRAHVRVRNTWELLLGQEPHSRWGCPFIQGKLIGIFSQAFDSNCWADESEPNYEDDSPWVDFFIYPSERTIVTDIRKLRESRQASRELHLNELIQQKTEQLRLSEERYRLLSDISADWVWEMDENLRYVYFSSGLHRTTGVHPQELMGKTREEVSSAASLASRDMQKHLLELQQRKEFRNFEYEFTTPKGTRFNVRIFGYPVFDSDQVFTGYIGTATDITAKVKTIKALEKAKNTAEQTTRAQTSFLANMSHEVRTPINAMIGIADILQDGGLGEEQRELLGKLKQSGQRLIGVVDDILKCSQLETGQVVLHPEELSVYLVCKEILSRFAAPAAEKEIAIRLDCEENELLHVGDARKIREVLVNFLDNALKFTSEGEISLGARKLGQDGDSCLFRFEVRDSGIGIDPEQVSRIFEPFVQADDGSTRSYGGVGVGLSISRKLVTLMGGRIGGESQPGQGSVFWFEIPLALA